MGSGLRVCQQVARRPKSLVRIRLRKMSLKLTEIRGPEVAVWAEGAGGSQVPVQLTNILF